MKTAYTAMQGEEALRTAGWLRAATFNVLYRPVCTAPTGYPSGCAISRSATKFAGGARCRSFRPDLAKSAGPESRVAECRDGRRTEAVRYTSGTESRMPRHRSLISVLVLLVLESDSNTPSVFPWTAKFSKIIFNII